MSENDEKNLDKLLSENKKEKIDREAGKNQISIDNFLIVPNSTKSKHLKKEPEMKVSKNSEANE